MGKISQQFFMTECTGAAKAPKPSNCCALPIHSEARIREGRTPVCPVSNGPDTLA